MSDSPLNDALARQYESWVYPRPLADLTSEPQDDFCDPSAYHELFWPDRPRPAGLDILSAGCGANQAALLAFRNPDARVVGIDVSEASLANQHRLKIRHGLANLELQRLPIEAAATLGRSFDLIAASGVLHHMADPLAGARSLGAVLKPDGVMVVMLYGRHGRSGVEMLQQMFRRLGLGRDAASLGVVKEVLQAIPRAHPVLALLAAVDDGEHDSGLVDLFLNARERSYDVPACLRLVEEAGLSFQGWFDNALYHPELWFDAGSEVYRRLSRLPEREIWAAMELALAPEHTRHIFLACRADRPASHYRIGFAGPAFLHSVPRWIDGWSAGERDGQTALLREAVTIPLAGAQAALARGIDGRTPVRALLTAEGEGLAGDFLRTLWRAGMIRMRT